MADAILEGLLKKLYDMGKRYQELDEEIQKPEVMQNNAVYSKYMKEHGTLARIITPYRELKKLQEEMKDVEAMKEQEQDIELKEIAAEELEILMEKEKETYEHLKDLLIQDDEINQKNVIIELRAGTGGEEASLFALNLYEMYVHYAELKNWKVEVLDSSPTDLGGLKEIVFSIKGKEVYKNMKYESGGHRVQRVPATENSGRIHTSACTVVVLPEAEEVEIEINPKDLRIDTLRASGPGGQNVNKTSSAIRITHLPTGIVVNCQDTPEQYKNKMKAMRILRTKLYQKEQQELHDKRNEMRRSQQGSGDRSDRIRTYNYPQNRVTDHRINVSVYNLQAVMQGDLDEFILGLQRQEREQLVAALQED